MGPSHTVAMAQDGAAPWNQPRSRAGAVSSSSCTQHPPGQDVMGRQLSLTLALHQPPPVSPVPRSDAKPCSASHLQDLT